MVCYSTCLIKPPTSVLAFPLKVGLRGEGEGVAGVGGDGVLLNLPHQATHLGAGVFSEDGGWEGRPREQVEGA